MSNIGYRLPPSTTSNGPVCFAFSKILRALPGLQFTLWSLSCNYDKNRNYICHTLLVHPNNIGKYFNVNQIKFNIHYYLQNWKSAMKWNKIAIQNIVDLKSLLLPIDFIQTFHKTNSEIQIWKLCSEIQSEPNVWAPKLFSI